MNNVSNDELNHRMLMMTLTAPAAAVVLDQFIDDRYKAVIINNSELEGNDTPWGSLVADLLIDANARTFNGMTFGVDPRDDSSIAKGVYARLDPSVVRYRDILDTKTREHYPVEMSQADWFEIVWAPAEQFEVECAQLLCGQWFWLYDDSGVELPADHVVGFELLDLDDVLRDHQLTLPRLALPLLDVKWR